MGRNYSKPTLKILWGLSAGKCAYPNCRETCIKLNANGDGFVIMGEMAHIFAYSDGGPRANPQALSKSRNEGSNLIILCPNHHTIVDNKQNAKVYTADILMRWKHDLETWVQNQTTNSMLEVTFVELEIVTKAILDSPIESNVSVNFDVTAPLEKMRKNSLTRTTLDLMYHGVAQAPMVEKFVTHTAMLWPRFPERLKTGFLAEYNRLRELGLSGDSLFEALHQFSYGNHGGFKERAAGLAVLVYLFQKCEIFEP